jgi:dTDP-glucose 4,6-dehydratase
MRVVITGGAGFIGSHLCEALVKADNEVICLDNLITGNLENIEHLFGNDGFRFIRHDVTEFIHVAGRVDYVLHFASPASPIDFEKIPIQILKVGALGTHKALGLARANKAGFLLASTSECYGDPLVHPQPETYWGNVNPVGIRGVYDEAKRFAEAMTMAYHRHHGVNTHIVRIFNTYGPKMRPEDGRAIPAFISQALKGEPITIFGDGTQTRSFQYIDDLIAGLMALMASDEHLPTNIGNPHEFTIRELAETIVELTGSQSQVSFGPLPPDDPKVRQPDITKARERLKWEPEIQLREGLGHTIRWFKSRQA